MLLLNEKDIRAVFTMEDAIESNIEAYKIFSSGNAVVPLRQVLAADGDRGNFAFMPAYSSKLGAAGIKIVNIFPGNRELGEATTKGQVLLMDDRNGEIVALMDRRIVNWRLCLRHAIWMRLESSPEILPRRRGLSLI